MLEKLFAKRHIQNLNLDSVRAKAVEKLGWSEIKAMQVERDYRRFLYALAHKRKEDIISPPTQEVDEFWHQHILDTRKYREDCDTIFGHYIDHTPGLSPANQSKADARRRQIYRDYHIDTISFDRDAARGSPEAEVSFDGGSDSSLTSHTGHSGHSSHDCHDAGAGHAHGGEAGSHGGDGGHAGDGGCDGGSGGGDGGGGGGGDGGGGGCGGGGCGGG